MYIFEGSKNEYLISLGLKSFSSQITNLLSSKLNFKDIKGGIPSYNASRLIELFQGKKDSYRDITIINSIYAMQTIKPTIKFDECFDILSNSLDTSKALNHLNKIKK